MPLDEFFDRMRRSPDLGPNVVRWHREPAREGVTADFPDWTPPAVRAAYVNARRNPDVGSVRAQLTAQYERFWRK